MTDLQYNNKEVKAIKWFYHIIFATILSPFIAVYGLTYYISYWLEKMLKYVLSNLKTIILEWYVRKTKLPEDGRRGRLLYLKVSKIISSFSNGLYDCYYHEKGMDYSTQVEIHNGEIKTYIGSKPEFIESIYRIGDVNIKNLK